ncbi:hypothetical protein K504DRAFT_497702 [Pleomassaria siparia CBS 279.74]|uniref:Uncharacterized protein n=1 Tax=Pleomassaria siparia CBS 279.74 TaxID=1314801 RepID=A0A6G1KJR1_9PLEO|nr:hypothetical protein K504DRAFT_497702 [Pleomassaria siparia CBS 279.74]
MFQNMQKATPTDEKPARTEYTAPRRRRRREQSNPIRAGCGGICQSIAVVCLAALMDKACPQLDRGQYRNGFSLSAGAGGALQADIKPPIPTQLPTYPTGLIPSPNQLPQSSRRHRQWSKHNGAVSEYALASPPPDTTWGRDGSPRRAVPRASQPIHLHLFNLFNLFMEHPVQSTMYDRLPRLHSTENRTTAGEAYQPRLP